MDANGLVIHIVSGFNTHECFSRFLERRTQFPALHLVLCTAVSRGRDGGYSCHRSLFHVFGKG